MDTRQIASVRNLIRQSPIAAAALVFGGLAITGAPPLAVFLSEFSILKAGLTQKHYVATGLLAIFIVIAFFGIMLHINRMVFGTQENRMNGLRDKWIDERQIPPVGRSNNPTIQQANSLQLPTGADSGRRAGIRARFLYSAAATPFTDSGGRCVNEMINELP